MKSIRPYNGIDPLLLYNIMSRYRKIVPTCHIIVCIIDCRIHYSITRYSHVIRVQYLIIGFQPVFLVVCHGSRPLELFSFWKKT